MLGILGKTLEKPGGRGRPPAMQKTRERSRPFRSFQQEFANFF
jgi:hypothetical protein